MIITSNLFSQAINHFQKYNKIFLDTETDGLYPYRGNSICGIGLAGDNGKAHYFPFRHKYLSSENLSSDQLQDLIILLNNTQILVGYNIKFDLHMLIKEGLSPWDKQLEDVIVAVRLTEPDQYPDLSLTGTIDRSYGATSGNYDRYTQKELRRNKWKNDYSLSPATLLGPYCEQDVTWTRKLYCDRLNQIKIKDQYSIWEMEIKLTKCLLRAEWLGIRIDKEYRDKARDLLRARQDVVSQRIFKGVNQEFNINSRSDLSHIFSLLGVESFVLTPKGNPSWDESALAQINHPVAGMIREYRTLTKMDSTYIEPCMGTDTIHANFLNWGAITGRLSSRSPNLQNLPAFAIPVVDVPWSNDRRKELEALLRGRRGSELIFADSALESWNAPSNTIFDDNSLDSVWIQRLYIPREGYALVTFDYAQAEMRVFASYLNNNDVLLAMQHADFDFHAEAAKLAYGITSTHPEFKVYRRLGKELNFGILYGLGIARLAVKLGVSEEEARAYKRTYMAKIPGARQFINLVLERAKQRGWVKNRFGRKYYIPEDREYIAINYLVQGTTADLLKFKMIDIPTNFVDTDDTRILSQVHDALDCEIRIDLLHKIIPEITALLTTNSLGIPMYVDVAVGYPSLAQKVKYKVGDMVNVR